MVKYPTQEFALKHLQSMFFPQGERSQVSSKKLQAENYESPVEEFLKGLRSHSKQDVIKTDFTDAHLYFIQTNLCMQSYCHAVSFLLYVINRSIIL
jgi:hypothetical protein